MIACENAVFAVQILAGKTRHGLTIQADHHQFAVNAKALLGFRFGFGITGLTGKSR